MNKKEFEGINVLITGASSGIGAEFARQFHQFGSNVILVARREDLLKDITDNLNLIRPNSARYITADLSAQGTGSEDLGTLDDVVKFINTETVDILVNNAGRGSFGYFHNLDIKEEEGLVLLNVVATMRLSHAVIPQMVARRSGAIISVSSIAAFQSLPFMATYAATKSFNLIHSIALRYELQSLGIKVVTLCPGPTDTEFAGVARVPGEFTGVGRDRVEDVVRDGIDALLKNRPFIVPGLRAKIISYLSRLLPRSITTKIGRAVLLPSLRAVGKDVS